MSSDEAGGLIPRQRVESPLTDDERAKLRGLVDELVSATEDRVFWLGQVRETALEIQRRMESMLGKEDE
ncbi:hypothetical protein [Streptomonospora litoralis]|uniref:Uncharacterized protein n=1 Tax=Streptomonospora litoralis TaxID=2498135 RepID=A0A4P6PY61_9ACTN|nr:hypothetical protein [Streptomonospora litoralis]QBI53158.1 hypothetical protein EKD16_06805 [Streptomonospora litoralis]